jgi:hypothetical protein
VATRSGRELQCIDAHLVLASVFLNSGRADSAAREARWAERRLHRSGDRRLQFAVAVREANAILRDARCAAGIRSNRGAI